MGLEALPQWAKSAILLMSIAIFILGWFLSRRAYYEKLCRNKILCHFIRPADDITVLLPVETVIEGVGVIKTSTDNTKDKKDKDGNPIYYAIPEAMRQSTYPQSGFMSRFGVRVPKITFLQGSSLPLIAMAGELALPEEFSASMVGKLRDESWTEMTVAQSKEEAKLTERLKQIVNPTIVYCLLIGCVIAVGVVGYLVWNSQELNIKTLESMQETLNILRAAQGV